MSQIKFEWQRCSTESLNYSNVTEEYDDLVKLTLDGKFTVRYYIVVRISQFSKRSNILFDGINERDVTMDDVALSVSKRSHSTTVTFNFFCLIFVTDILLNCLIFVFFHPLEKFIESYRNILFVASIFVLQ